MSGDAHVRICESLGVKFPRATRLVVVIRGRQFYLWRAVDSEGEVLDFLVQSPQERSDGNSADAETLEEAGLRAGDDCNR